jgi:hypothetical protein
MKNPVFPSVKIKIKTVTGECSIHDTGLKNKTRYHADTLSRHMLFL